MKSRDRDKFLSIRASIIYILLGYKNSVMKTKDAQFILKSAYKLLEFNEVGGS